MAVSSADADGGFCYRDIWVPQNYPATSYTHHSNTSLVTQCEGGKTLGTTVAPFHSGPVIEKRTKTTVNAARGPDAAREGGVRVGGVPTPLGGFLPEVCSPQASPCRFVVSAGEVRAFGSPPGLGGRHPSPHRVYLPGNACPCLVQDLG